MPSPQIERKLAAIMFTDIAGYTEQMSKDEAVAISLLNKKESVLKPLILEHNGTYVKSTGDGSLSHFNSAVDAATCAKRFQESIYDDKDLNVRVGVHLGDTIFEKGDIRGDGVNIASRLESMAVEGGVFVSKEVHDQLANQKEFEGVSLGLQSMKGVGRLIEVYGLKGDKLSEPNPTEYKDNKIDKHSDDEVPSVAIIPLKNKGEDNDTYYAYGISADLISDCSGAGLIRVESLDRIEKIENYDKLDITELASKLLVRYIATGSLWKMDNMFQLSIELYDTKESKVVWSDRWQEDWDNLSTIKGNLSDGLLKALSTKPKVGKNVEILNTEAYEYYLKGKYKYEKRKILEDINIAQGLLIKAIELDDKLILAKIHLGWTYESQGHYEKAMEIYETELKQAKKYSEKFSIGGCLRGIGRIYWVKGDYKTAIRYYKSSLKIFEEIGDKNNINQLLGDIGNSYSKSYGYGGHNNGLKYHFRSLKIATEIDDKRSMGHSLREIGNIYSAKIELNEPGDNNYDNAMDYYNESEKVFKEIEYEAGIGNSKHDKSWIYWNKGDYNQVLKDREYALAKFEEIGQEWSSGLVLLTLGDYHFHTGRLNNALELMERGYKIHEKIGSVAFKSGFLHRLGLINLYLTKYYIAIEYFEKSLSHIKEAEKNAFTEDIGHTTLNLFYCYKKVGKKYNKQKILNYIKNESDISWYDNFLISQLLEDNSYLKSAYSQVMKQSSKIEDRYVKNFLTSIIPAQIVEEWEKVK